MPMIKVTCRNCGLVASIQQVEGQLVVPCTRCSFPVKLAGAPLEVSSRLSAGEFPPTGPHSAGERPALSGGAESLAQAPLGIGAAARRSASDVRHPPPAAGALKIAAWVAGVVCIAGLLGGGTWIVARILHVGDHEFLRQRAAERAKFGDAAGAIEDLSEAIRLRPTDATLYRTRGELREKRGDIDGGIEDYRKALAGAAPSWEGAVECTELLALLHLRRGIAKEAVGDTPGALLEFDRSVQLAPTHVEARRRRAETRLGHHDMVGAAEDLSAAIQIGDPEWKCELHCLRGEVRQQQGMLSEAIADYQQALAANPNHLPAQRNLELAVAQRARNALDSMKQSVVLVAATTENALFTGSGFIVSASGRVVTNAHVVEGSKEIFVLWDRSLSRKYAKAHIVSSLGSKTPHQDLALLQIDEGAHFSACEVDFGPRVGDELIVLGFPLGSDGPNMSLFENPSIDLTSTRGVISAIKVAEDLTPLWIQTDARMSPGNSGGPVLDVRMGRVVGVVSCGLGDRGDKQNFAIHAQQLRLSRLLDR
ncbi:MAG: trypsin-like peptidase domain-containing protein [Planctomycetes bacterium]|nr:trypsin-like peptidase domain-containing protein [Planctomycetota bacterium]